MPLGPETRGGRSFLFAIKRDCSKKSKLLIKGRSREVRTRKDRGDL